MLVFGDDVNLVFDLDVHAASFAWNNRYMVQSERMNDAERKAMHKKSNKKRNLFDSVETIAKRANMNRKRHSCSDAKQVACKRERARREELRGTRGMRFSSNTQLVHLHFDRVLALIVSNERAHIELWRKSP